MKSLSRIAAGLLVASVAAGCAHGLRSGWVTLFDGRNLDNWTQVGGANWRLADGAVMADRSGSKGSGFLVSKESYRDFDLRVEFWADDDANSGIYMRCADRNKITDRSCYEANIFDKRPDPSYGTGAIVHRAIVKPMPKAGGRWNVYEITAIGPEVTVKLNGAVTVHMRDGELKQGPIALQWGNGTVKFRKVEIHPL
jgi:hypothetical protein